METNPHQANTAESASFKALQDRFKGSSEVELMGRMQGGIFNIDRFCYFYRANITHGFLDTSAHTLLFRSSSRFNMMISTY